MKAGDRVRIKGAWVPTWGVVAEVIPHPDGQPSYRVIYQREGRTASFKAVGAELELAPLEHCPCCGQVRPGQMP